MARTSATTADKVADYGVASDRPTERLAEVEAAIAKAMGGGPPLQGERTAGPYGRSHDGRLFGHGILYTETIGGTAATCTTTSTSVNERSVGSTRFAPNTCSFR